MSNNVLITTSSFGKVEESVLNPLVTRGIDFHLNPFGQKLSSDQLISLIERLDPVGIIAGTESYTRDVFQKAKSLKVISRVGVGTDGINFDIANEFNVKVLKTSDHVTAAVVELTVGMAFSLSRHLHLHNNDMKNQVWKKRMGQFVCGKTVGVVGVGKIGIEVAKTFKLLGCDILGYDPYPMKAPKDVAMVSYEDLLAKSDIVTFHCNASDINPIWTYEHAEMMKPDSILINCARGSLICEKSLRRALDNGHLSCAGLDVYSNEPYSDELTSNSKTLLTPHVGSYAKEARCEMEREAVNNLISSL